MKKKEILITACILAALSVALGAFGAHGLKALILPEKIEVFKTGVQYHFYHALALALVGLILQFIDNQWINRSIGFFILGILFFSGSLYLLTYFAATNYEGGKWVGVITPLGGAFFILAWISLAIGISKK